MTTAAGASDRYLVISSDCHAGLPNEQYTEWLDPEHREAFTQSLAERARLMAILLFGFVALVFAISIAKMTINR